MAVLRRQRGSEAVRLASEHYGVESARIAALRDRLEEILLSIEGARRNGHPAKRLYNNVNITIPYVHAADLMTALKDDAAFSSGSACSSADLEENKVSHVLSAIGLEDELARCTIRIGLGRFNTEEEVEYAGKKIVTAALRLRDVSPQYQLMTKKKSLPVTALTH